MKQQREIKFRAWDKHDMRYIIHEQDFIPVKVTNHGVLKLNPYHKENFWEFQQHERFIIEQYTGLKDKNGAEIYEGDICNVSGHYVGDYWQPESKGPVEYENGSYLIADEFSHELCEEDVFNHQFEIIGNIHENKELLK